MIQLRTALASALVLGSALAHPAAAQHSSPVALEIRGGGVTATGGARDRVTGGWTLSGTAHLRLSERLDAYAGYQHDDLSPVAYDSTGERTHADGYSTTDNGVRAGLRLRFPLPRSAVQPWGETGLLYNRMSIVVPNTSKLEFDWRLGFEAGAGVAVKLAPRLSFTPGVRFRYHESHLHTGNMDYIPSGMTSLTFDAGLQFRP